VQAEVRKLADAFRERYQRLDVLVNNAGAIFMSRQVSRDGLEMTFALNHLGYFLLTNLLLDLLIASAPARVVNVSSGAHLGGKINFADLQLERSYTGFGAYSQSKLANVLFTYELARRLQGTGVTVNALHPGFVATNFGRSNGGLFDPLFRLIQRFGALTPEKGAETTVYLAVSPEVEGVTGKYFANCKPAASSALSNDETTARRLWEVSEQLTG
jgi:NAD(P)-dependent dehydrogenase (short-subunit alcohol dehydrogenase family)